MLVLGDSKLTLDFCMRKASPGKPELFRGLKRVTALRKQVSGPVAFRHVGRGNNQLADWLTCIAKALEQSAAVEKLLPNDVTLFSGPVWDPTKSAQYINRSKWFNWVDTAQEDTHEE